MKLLEYQAKELFAKYGLRVQKSSVISEKAGAAGQVEAAGLRYPLVVKAQIPAGGRGKAGGIRFADNPGELTAIVESLLLSELKGHKVYKLLAAEKADIETEWYLSILLDRNSKSPRIIFSTRGGVDIEDVAAKDPSAVVSLPVNPLLGVTDYIVQYLCSKSGAGNGCFEVLKDALNRLYSLFMENSCLLAEINPVSVGSDGTLLAIDGKAEIDDSALYRLSEIAAYRDGQGEHPLAVEARASGFVYIPLEKGSRIAAMSNGSGMLMSMIDLLGERDVAAACALDLGGGAKKERIEEAVRIVFSTPGVDTLFVSIFGGITRCDEVAGGLKDALAKLNAGTNYCRTAILRMEGTNKDAGVALISSTPDVTLVDGLQEGVTAAVTRCCS